MKKFRVVVDMDEDIFDELCSYREERLNILFAKEVIITQNESDISHPEEEA